MPRGERHCARVSVPPPPTSRAGPQNLHFPSLPALHFPSPHRKPLLIQAENFTLFIKNTVTFSKFNFSK